MQMQTTSFIFNNFPLLMCVLAILFALMIPTKFNQRFFSYMLFFVIGIGGIWDFAQHNSYLQQITPHPIGWEHNPLELPFAMANLGLGVAGIIASFANWSYRAAVVTISSIWFLSCATFQIDQMIYAQNFNLNNGSILLTNLLVSLILIILLILGYEKKDNSTIYY